MQIANEPERGIGNLGDPPRAVGVVLALIVEEHPEPALGVEQHLELLRGCDVPTALASTAAAVFGVLRVTVESGRSELALVQAQDELVHPSHQFTPTRLS